MRKIIVKKREWSDEIIVNGVRLKASKCGRIMKYTDKANAHYSVGWNLSKTKPNSNGYVYIQLKKKKYRVHRLVYYAFFPNWDINNSKLILDHIDGNKNNNRLDNLREVTVSQNRMNMETQVNNRGGFKNIYPEYHKKNNSWYWRIYVVLNGYAHKKAFKAGDGLIPDQLPPIPKKVIDKRNAMLVQYHGAYARF